MATPPVLVPSCLVAVRLARTIPNPLSLGEGQVALTDPDKVLAASRGTCSFMA